MQSVYDGITRQGQNKIYDYSIIVLFELWFACLFLDNARVGTCFPSLSIERNSVYLSLKFDKLSSCKDKNLEKWLSCGFHSLQLYTPT